MVTKKDISDFFDLNMRAANYWVNAGGSFASSLPPKARKGFDYYLAGLKSGFSSKFGRKQQSDKTLQERKKAKFIQVMKNSKWWLSAAQQFLMVIGVFVGVIFSDVIGQFQNGSQVTIGLTIGKIGVSVLVALILTPVAFSRLDPSSPYIVKFALFIQSGVFWRVIIETIAKIS
jgi:hypothetical protein